MDQTSTKNVLIFWYVTVCCIHDIYLIQLSVPGEVLECPHDGCTFKSMYDRSLQKHLKQKHSKEKTQICYICGFQTRHSSSLSKHLMLHKEFKPYKCVHCSFVALYPSEVIAHARSKHLKQKRFSCPVCQFQTSYALAIQKHVQRHNGNQAYACSVCGKALESMRKAKKHMKVEHGCTEYKIINESTIDKVKPSNFKIKTSDESHLVESYHVMVVKVETAEKEAVKNQVIKAAIGSENDLEIGTNSTVSVEPSNTSQNLISASLEHESNPYNNSSSQASKGGNPMLSATTNDLGDTDNSLIDDSLFDLMSDFPRPPALNRSQSASTLMFASFSPHVIDRSMTPDFFFTDSPSVGTFFPNFPSKNLDSESLTLGNLTNFDQPPQSTIVPPSNISHLASSSSSSVRGANTPSPILPSFLVSSVTGNVSSLNTGSISASFIQDTGCMDMDSVLPSSDMSLSQLSTESASEKTAVSFVRTNSAFGSLNQFSNEIQAAVASIHPPEECISCAPQNSCLSEESPFPTNTVL